MRDRQKRQRSRDTEKRESEREREIKKILIFIMVDGRLPFILLGGGGELPEDPRHIVPVNVQAKTRLLKKENYGSGFEFIGSEYGSGEKF